MKNKKTTIPVKTPTDRRFIFDTTPDEKGLCHAYERVEFYDEENRRITRYVERLCYAKCGDALFISEKMLREMLEEKGKADA